MNLRRRVVAVLVAGVVGLGALAARAAEAPTDPSVGPETGLPVPRFVALKADEVNLRAGPGTRYPVQWVYKRRYMPVEITAEFEAWRHIRDHAGTTGWVHHSMLTGRRTVLVIGEMRTLYSEPDPASRPVARLEPGTLGAVERCSGTWCAVEFAGIDGWLRRSEVFGLYPDEEIR